MYFHLLTILLLINLVKKINLTQNNCEGFKSLDVCADCTYTTLNAALTIDAEISCNEDSTIQILDSRVYELLVNDIENYDFSQPSLTIESLYQSNQQLPLCSNLADIVIPSTTSIKLKSNLLIFQGINLEVNGNLSVEGDLILNNSCLTINMTILLINNQATTSFNGTSLILNNVIITDLSYGSRFQFLQETSSNFFGFLDFNFNQISLNCSNYIKLMDLTSIKNGEITNLYTQCMPIFEIIGYDISSSLLINNLSISQIDLIDVEFFENEETNVYMQIQNFDLVSFDNISITDASFMTENTVVNNYNIIFRIANCSNVSLQQIEVLNNYYNTSSTSTLIFLEIIQLNSVVIQNFNVADSVFENTILISISQDEEASFVSITESILQNLTFSSSIFFSQYQNYDSSLYNMQISNNTFSFLQLSDYSVFISCSVYSSNTLIISNIFQNIQSPDQTGTLLANEHLFQASPLTNITGNVFDCITDLQLVSIVTGTLNSNNFTNITIANNMPAIGSQSLVINNSLFFLINFSYWAFISILNIDQIGNLTIQNTTFENIINPQNFGLIYTNLNSINISNCNFSNQNYQTYSIWIASSDLSQDNLINIQNNSYLNFPILKQIGMIPSTILYPNFTLNIYDINVLMTNVTSDLTPNLLYTENIALNITLLNWTIILAQSLNITQQLTLISGNNLDTGVYIVEDFIIESYTNSSIILIDLSTTNLISFQGINFTNIILQGDYITQIYRGYGNITCNQIYSNSIITSNPIFEIGCYQTQILYSMIVLNNIMIQNFSSNVSSNLGLIHLSDDGLSNLCFYNISLTNSDFSDFFEFNNDYLHTTSIILTKYTGSFNLSIFNASFNNLSSSRGSAIALLAYSSTFNSNIQIQESFFNNNQAYYDGGCIYTLINQIAITDCIFTNNTALYGSGAVLYLANIEDTLNDQIEWIINNNTLMYNVGFFEILPTISTPTNYSISSNPICLVITDIKTNQTGVYFNENYDIFNATAITLQNINWTLQLVDAFNQIILDYSYLQGDYSLNQKNIKMYTDNYVYTSSDCNMESCNITNPEILLTGNANQNLPVYMTYYSTQFSDIPVIQFNFTLRSCIPGEINTTYGCITCSSGYYSLSPTQTACLICPNDAECHGSQVTSNPGFYAIENEDSVEVITCFISQNCLGNNTCNEGYTGIACFQCDIDNFYVLSNDFTCTQCEDIGLSVFYMVLLLLYNITYLWLYSEAIFRSSKFAITSTNIADIERKISGTVYLRLLITYCQILIITNNYIFNISGIVQNLQIALGIAIFVGNPNETITKSTLCGLLKLGFDESLIYFINQIIMISLPIVCIILISSIKLVIWRFSLDAIKVTNLYNTVLSMLVFSQPCIIIQLIKFASCETFAPGSSSYNIVTNSVCYTEIYDNVLLYFIIPNFILWFLILPILYVVLLRVNKDNLYSHKVRLSLGSLINGFKEENYNWSINLLIFKTLLAAIPFFFYFTQQKTLIALTVLLLLYTYYGIFTQKRPYILDDANNIGRVCLSGNILMVFFALYFSNTSSVINTISGFFLLFFSMSILLLLVWRLWKVYALSMRAMLRKLGQVIFLSHLEKNEENELDLNLDRRVYLVNDLVSKESFELKSNISNVIL